MILLCNHLVEKIVRGKKTDFSDARCSIARAAGLVGDPWSLLIVRDTLRGTRRYGEFRRSPGLAKNILADRLRKLVDAGVLETRPIEESGHSEYLLTDRGRQLSVVLVALAQWGGSHAFTIDEQHSVVDWRDGSPVRVVVLASDGRELGPGDTTLVMREDAA